MPDDNDRIIEELRAELEKAKKREEDFNNTRRAMLYMLEDLNDSTHAIERAKMEWETTFDAITSPLFIHDKGFNIIRANRAYMESAGIPFKDFMGKPYYTIFPVREKPFATCLRAIEEEGVEEEITVPSLNKVFMIRTYSIKNDEGVYSYGVHILEDITTAKGLEAKLKEEVATTTDLLRIAEATASIKDIDKLISEVIKSTARILKADVCMGYLRGHSKEAFIPYHAYGVPGPRTSLFKTRALEEGEWFIKDVIDNKDVMITHAPFVSPAHAGNTFITDFFFSWLPGMSSMLLIPLAGRAGVNGLLISFYKIRRDLSENDKMVIQGIMHQVSTALEEARLYRESVDKAMELSHKIEIVKVMREIDRSVLSILNPDDVLETVVTLLGRLVPCDRATVAVADRGRGGFIYKAGFGVDMPKGTFVEFSITSAANLLAGGEVEFTPDLSTEETLLPLEKRLLDDGFLSHIRVPITAKGKVGAVLSIGSKKAGIFKREDLSTLESLANQIGIALENARLFSDLQELLLNIIKTLSSVIDAKSAWTMGHSERVTNYAVSIGKGMGFDDKTIDDLRIAGLLHDIGKIGTYDVILDKPGRLNEDELKIVREHPGRGAEFLGPIKQFMEIARWVKHHHEWYDGSGYPEGLKGEEIPLQSRVLAVADTFDSMTAERPYRPTPGWERALDELKKFSGTQFDPQVVEAFLRVVKSVQC